MADGQPFQNPAAGTQIPAAWPSSPNGTFNGLDVMPSDESQDRPQQVSYPSAPRGAGSSSPASGMSP
jgi:hypothetical protein